MLAATALVSAYPSLLHSSIFSFFMPSTISIIWFHWILFLCSETTTVSTWNQTESDTIPPVYPFTRTPNQGTCPSPLRLTVPFSAAVSEDFLLGTVPNTTWLLCGTPSLISAGSFSALPINLQESAVGNTLPELT